MKLKCIKAAYGLEVGNCYEKALPVTDDWNEIIFNVAVVDDFGDVRFH